MAFTDITKHPLREGLLLIARYNYFTVQYGVHTHRVYLVKNKNSKPGVFVYEGFDPSLTVDTLKMLNLKQLTV